jgi:hypothetical protein
MGLPIESPFKTTIFIRDDGPGNRALLLKV